MTSFGPDPGERIESDVHEEADRQADELADGSLDPDELTVEPSWWDEGSDDEN